MKLLYFAPVALSSYWQRPHYLIEFLLRNGVDDVTWVDPFPCRLPRLADFLRQSDCPPNEAKVFARVKVLHVPTLPIEPLPGMRLLNSSLLWHRTQKDLYARHKSPELILGVGKPSRLAGWALRHMAHRHSFYDAMDDFPAFYSGLSRRAMQQWESSVAAGVTGISVSSEALRERFVQTSGTANISVVANGYDMRTLPPATAGEIGAPVIGYVGTLADWFDWPLVVELAESLPDATVRLIGPVFGAKPPNLPSNVELLPACTTSDAMQYVRRFTVGLIPFRINRLTASVDPIKFYEYRALGVPVFSTKFGAMGPRLGMPHVYQVQAGADWRILWRTVLDRRPDASDVMAFRQANDWNCRFEANVNVFLG